MRKLNVPQRHLLDKAMKDDPTIQRKENLPIKTINIIEKINIYENMDSDIDQYLLNAWMARNAN